MKQVIFFFIVIALIMISCHKNAEYVSTAQHSSLLKKFIIVDSITVSQYDTVRVINYSYDNLGRCNHITSNTPGSIVNEDIYYNNTDTLMSWYRIFYPGFTFSEYFTYDANDNMITDTFYSGTAGIMSTYNLNYSPIIYSTVIENNHPYLKGNYFLINRDAGGNITNSKDSCFYYDNNSGNYTFYQVLYFTISYDNHPCPFYKLYPKRLVEPELHDAYAIGANIPFYHSNLQPNNILQEYRTIQVNTGSDYSNRFTYQYNSNGYPSIVQFEDLLTGQNYKGIYIYD